MISARFHRDEITSRADYVMFLVSGVLIAHYTTELAAHFFEISLGTAGGVGFLLGAFGGSVMQAVIRGIRSADLWGVLRDRFGGKK